MKCPNCGYLCSDLRDVCGKCVADLRPKKRELGIKIMHPGTPYEELASKVAKKVVQSAEPKGGLFGGLKAFFGGPAEQPPAVRWEPIAEAEPPVPADAPAEEPAQRKPPMQLGRRAPTFERRSVAVTTDQPQHVTTAPAGELQTAPPRTPMPVAPEERYGALSTADLWCETDLELNRHKNGSSLELSSFHLRDFDAEREEIEILWALSDEAIRDPEALKRYKDIKRSESREVRAEQASKALAKVERSLTAPVFNLATGGPKLTQKDETETVEAPIRAPVHDLNPATPNERFISGLVDAGYILFLSLIVTWSLAWFGAPELRNSLFRPASLPEPDLLTLGAVFFCIALLFGFLYPWLSGTRTAGQKLMGLEVIEESGRDPSQAELFIRSALLPWCSVLQLLVPPLWKEPALHNRLAHTLINRVSHDNQ